MFKFRFVFLSCLISYGAIPIVFAEEDCVAAVDAADTLNVNNNNCDYSDKGLNGILHKAFTKKADVKKEVLDAKATEPSASISFVLTAETDQWAHAAVAKAQLLPQAFARCEHGFSVLAEDYRPLTMGKIEISLHCVCL